MRVFVIIEKMDIFRVDLLLCVRIIVAIVFGKQKGGGKYEDDISA